jgi:hypothetical protein
MVNCGRASDAREARSMFRRSTPLAAVLAAFVLVSGTLVLAPRALASALPVPLPAEAVLTDVERHHVLATMRPAERRLVGPLFADDAAGLVLSYTRRLYRIVTSPTGAPRLQELVPVTSAPGSGLRIPTEAVAGSATKEDLYVSFTVVKIRSSAPYEWQVAPYAQWNGPDGMNPTNSSADAFAVAWAGSSMHPTYVHRQSGAGQRTSNWPCNSEPLDIWPSDATPNVGTGWSFHEFGMWGCPMRWGWADIRLRTDKMVGRTDNLVMKYFHTFGGLTYDLTFSQTPAVTISPTNEQWSLALFATYRH